MLLRGLLDAAERRRLARQPHAAAVTASPAVAAAFSASSAADVAKHRLSGTSNGVSPDLRPNSTRRIGGTPRLTMLGGASNLDLSHANLVHSPEPGTLSPRLEGSDSAFDLWNYIRFAGPIVFASIISQDKS